MTLAPHLTPWRTIGLQKKTLKQLKVLVIDGCFEMGHEIPSMYQITKNQLVDLLIKLRRLNKNRRENREADASAIRSVDAMGPKRVKSMIGRLPASAKAALLVILIILAAGLVPRTIIPNTCPRPNTTIFRWSAAVVETLQALFVKLYNQTLTWKSAVYVRQLYQVAVLQINHAHAWSQATFKMIYELLAHVRSQLDWSAIVRALKSAPGLTHIRTGAGHAAMFKPGLAEIRVGAEQATAMVAKALPAVSIAQNAAVHGGAFEALFSTTELFEYASKLFLSCATGVTLFAMGHLR